jgi:hypothetical protein
MTLKKIKESHRERSSDTMTQERIAIKDFREGSEKRVAMI